MTWRSGVSRHGVLLDVVDTPCTWLPTAALNMLVTCTKGEVEMRSYAITDDMKKGSVEALFDLMAERMVDFAAECGESMQTPEGGEAPILGFCFSFPVKQSALDHGTLIRWTKGALYAEYPAMPSSQHCVVIWSLPNVPHYILSDAPSEEQLRSTMQQSCRRCDKPDRCFLGLSKQCSPSTHPEGILAQVSS